MKSSARRRLTLSVLGFLALGFLPNLPAASHSPAHLSTIPAASGPWLDRFNSWRMSTGLPTLAENATWSAGDYNHALYMVQTGQVTHSESTAYPQYTPSGDLESQNSNIFVSSSTGTSDTQAIDWWMGAPFHAMAMMDPRLTTTGFGSYRNSSYTWAMGAALDVGQGLFNSSPHYPVYFPGNLSTEPLTAFSGNEFPNPQQACPGYSGLPVFVEVGANVNTVVGAHTMTGNGSALTTCTIDSSNPAFTGYLKWRGGVIVMPQSPLQNGVTYTVAVTVNGAPYTWSFTVGPLVTAPGPPIGVTATAGDATATVTWSAPSFDGGSAVTSYTVTPYIGTFAQASRVVTAPATAAVFNGLTNGTTYWFTVAATNVIGTGAAASSNSVTPTSTITPPARKTASSVGQYSLPNSDGVTWQDMDATNLSLSVTPAANVLAIVSANADLWTANAGYNQDIGIWMSPSGAPAGIVAWKESGGLGGTYSPNAAAVQTVVSLSANVTYSFKVRWKTNRSALGATIYAGAGPLAGGGGISPTRLTVHLAPASSVATGATNQQYTLANSDGATWQPLDATNLIASLSPGAASMVIVSGNADLWTVNAGYNQDIGIFVSVNGGPDQLVAWKESGGSAGTYSPNAAFVQAVYSMSAGSTYLFKLKWKTNKGASGATIFAAAGSAGSYSPTRLTAQLVSTADVLSSSRTQQYSLGSSNGASWTEIDPSLRVSQSPTVSQTMLLGANADLWTANAGYNQDIGIFVSVNGGADQLVAWKESGGFAGTFSPNAAYVESVYNVSPGSTYVFKLEWKTNQNASGATIYAGAGPSGGFYSPTSLTDELLN